MPRRLLILGLLAVMALAWRSAAADELRLLPPWRDAQGVRLAWHDPTGIRAVVESSTDLKLWFHAEGIYRPGLTSYVLYPARPMSWSRGITSSGETPFGLSFRLRRVPVPREGRVMFANHLMAAGINAPVIFIGDRRPGTPLGGHEELSDGRFLAQLIVDVAGVYHGPVGEPVRFRPDAGRGFVLPGEVIVPMAEDTDEIRVTMAAWAADLGTSCNEAASKGVAGFGTSNRRVLQPTVNPSAPAAPLVGLHPFSIAGIVGGPAP